MARKRIDIGDAIFFFKGNADALVKASKFVISSVTSVVKTVVKTMAAAAVAVAAFVTAAVFKFSQLETGIAEIITLFGDIGPATKQLKKDIQGVVQNLLTEFGQRTPAAIKATYDAVSAGIKEADIGGFMQDAARLAVAGVTDISQSVDVLTSVVNAFGLSAEDAESVSDKLFTTVKLGKTTISELSSSIGKVAPLASAAGVSLSEMLAAIASLTAQGLSTPIAITGIKAALQSIIKPTAEAEELAEQLGINFSAAAVASKGLQAVFDELKIATGGSVENMAKMIGSVEGLNAVLALTSETGAKKFRSSIGEIEKSSGATATAFIVISDTLGQKFKELIGNFTATIQNIGQVFEKPFKTFFDVINKFFKDNKKTFKTFFDDAKDVADGLVVPLKNIFGTLETIANYILSTLNPNFSLLESDITVMLASFNTFLQEHLDDIFKFVDKTIEVAGNMWGALMGDKEDQAALVKNLARITEVIKTVLIAAGKIAGAAFWEAFVVAAKAATIASAPALQSFTERHFPLLSHLGRSAFDLNQPGPSGANILDPRDFGVGGFPLQNAPPGAGPVTNDTPNFRSGTGINRESTSIDQSITINAETVDGDFFSDMQQQQFANQQRGFDSEGSFQISR